VAWYRLSADQGNKTGDNNLHNLCFDLDRSHNHLCHLDTVVNDPAVALVQRRATIVHLENKITGLETDALQDEMDADHLANMGDNKHAPNNAIARGINNFMDSVGTVMGTPARVQAPQLRQEAAVLREQLAELKREDQLASNVLPP